MKKLANWKKVSAFLLAAVLAVSGFAAVSVYAAGKIDFSQKAVLKVDLSGNSYKELKQNSVDVKLYKVADVDENGKYISLIDSLDLSGISDKTTASEWKEMSENAAEDKLLEAMDVKTAEITDGTYANVEFDGENDEFGMYLMVVEPVETDSFAYSFAPSLVAVPGNNYYSYDADGTAQPSGADDSWVYDNLVAYLKPEFLELYGNLEIVKTLDTFNTSLNETSFVFEVQAYKDYSDVDEFTGEKLVYSNVVSLDFDGASASGKKLTIEGIPAGAVVTVTEVYSGATYYASAGETAQTTIVKDGTVSVDFANGYDDTLTGNGTAVINEFSYTDGDWNWSPAAE